MHLPNTTSQAEQLLTFPRVETRASKRVGGSSAITGMTVPSVASEAHADSQQEDAGRLPAFMLVPANRDTCPL